MKSRREKKESQNVSRMPGRMDSNENVDDIIEQADALLEESLESFNAVRDKKRTDITMQRLRRLQKDIAEAVEMLSDPECLMIAVTYLLKTHDFRTANLHATR